MPNHQPIPWWLMLTYALATIAALATGCATETDRALEALDHAAALGLVAPRIEHPTARLCDSPWSRGRCLEIAR